MSKLFKITKNIDIIADKAQDKIEPLKDQLSPVLAKVDSALVRVDSVAVQFERVAKESQMAIGEVGKVAESVINLTANVNNVLDKAETFLLIGGIALVIIGYFVFNGYQRLNKRLERLENGPEARDNKENS